MTGPDGGGSSGGNANLPLPLRTERLELRLFTPDDLGAYHAYQRLPEVARYLARPPRSLDACADELARHTSQPPWDRDGDKAVLAITRRDEPGVVGEIMLRLDDALAQLLEIGWIVSPAHAGQGYASEAARAVAGAAFDRLGAQRIFARLDAANTASERVCQRLGMRREAHLVDDDGGSGERADEGVGEYVYAVLEEGLRR